MPTHADVTVVATAPGPKSNMDSDSLLLRLAVSDGAFKADDITFSVWTKMDATAHSLPVSGDTHPDPERDWSDTGSCLS